jgi:hypothetical protein
MFGVKYDMVSLRMEKGGMVSFLTYLGIHSIIMDTPLLQTLARLMREEMKRSIDLCINIVSVFFSISNFSQFHQIIMDNQVGRSQGMWFSTGAVRPCKASTKEALDWSVSRGQ